MNSTLIGIGDARPPVSVKLKLTHPAITLTPEPVVMGQLKLAAEFYAVRL